MPLAFPSFFHLFYDGYMADMLIYIYGGKRPGTKLMATIQASSTVNQVLKNERR